MAKRDSGALREVQPDDDRRQTFHKILLAQILLARSHGPVRLPRRAGRSRSVVFQFHRETQLHSANPPRLFDQVGLSGAECMVLDMHSERSRRAATPDSR
jgi:hypothetical protein